jgi:hypothetical protein
MLIKINESGSIFYDALEYIKVTNSIKTASKAAVGAILEHQGLHERIEALEKMLYEEREKVFALEHKEKKTKEALKFLKSL